MAARFREAENAAREAYHRRQEVFGVEDPDTLETMRRLALALEKQNRFAEAEKASRMVLDVRRRVLGPEHPKTLKASDDLGVLLVEEDRYSEAERYFSRRWRVRSEC